MGPNSKGVDSIVRSLSLAENLQPADLRELFCSYLVHLVSLHCCQRTFFLSFGNAMSPTRIRPSVQPPVARESDSPRDAVTTRSDGRDSGRVPSEGDSMERARSNGAPGSVGNSSLGRMTDALHPDRGPRSSSGPRTPRFHLSPEVRDLVSTASDDYLLSVVADWANDIDIG